MIIGNNVQRKKRPSEKTIDNIGRINAHNDKLSIGLYECFFEHRLEYL